MTGVLRPAEHEVRAIQTQTTVTLVIDNAESAPIAIEFDEKSMWSVLEPLLAFWSYLEQADEPFEPSVAQQTLPF